MFFGGRKQKTTTFFFSSWISIKSFRIQLQKNFANIWRIERDRIRAIKFKAARIQFSSDVFVAVRRRCCLSSLLTFRKRVQSSEAKGVVSLASRWYSTIVIDLIGQSSLDVREVIAGRPWVKPWFYFLYWVLWRLTVISFWYVFCRPSSLMDSPQLLDLYGILRGG